MNKSELRQLFKKKRKELSDEQLREKSLSIENQIFDRIDFQTVRFVHVFLPIERLREIDTFPIINRLRKEFAEITVCVPKIIDVESQMEHIALREDSEFQINEFGISEPIDGEHVEPNEFDIVFVPLLCADKEGNRIGYVEIARDVTSLVLKEREIEETMHRMREVNKIASRQGAPAVEVGTGSQNMGLRSSPGNGLDLELSPM